MRTCVGCRQTGERGDLLRLVVGEDGGVVADLAATAFGRGAWVHARPACLREAAVRGLARSLKRPVSIEPETLFGAVRAAADRRVAGLLASARARGALAVGADAVGEALRSGRAEVVVVARDARASVQTLPTDVASRATVWGDKCQLGDALSRGETGVVAVLDVGLAGAIRRSAALSTLSLSDAPSAPERIPARLEVR